jgi:hypothetical protein
MHSKEHKHSNLKSIQNHLLRTLPRAALDELLPSLRRVPLPSKQVLHQRGDHLDYAYFPETRMVSVVVELEDGDTIEPPAMRGWCLALSSSGARSLAAKPWFKLRELLCEDDRIDQCADLLHCLGRMAWMLKCLVQFGDVGRPVLR